MLELLTKFYDFDNKRQTALWQLDRAEVTHKPVWTINCHDDDKYSNGMIMQEHNSKSY